MDEKTLKHIKDIYLVQLAVGKPTITIALPFFEELLRYAETQTADKTVVRLLGRTHKLEEALRWIKKDVEADDTDHQLISEVIDEALSYDD